MKIKHVTPIMNVADVPASIAWFESLGWQRAFSWNEAGAIDHAADRNAHGAATFAGVCSGEVDLFMCKDGQGSRRTAGPVGIQSDGVWMSWWVESVADVDEMFATATRLGYEVTQPPRNEPWGVREFHLRHPDGHTIRVSAGSE